MIHRMSFRAMGTEMMILLRPNETWARQTRSILEQAARRMAAYEKRLSRFSPESELNMLNLMPGRPVLVGPLLFALLQRAEEHWRTSGGLFHPGILPALEAAGYDRDFQDLKSTVGAPAKKKSPQALPLQSGFELNHFLRTVQLTPGIRLDLGGIAKGWCADRIAEWLGFYGDALVDAGGDIRTVGRKQWRVRLHLPQWESNLSGRSLPLLRAGLRLKGNATATSSVLKRHWQSGDQSRHHLIDPTTGYPAQTNLVQATVIAESAEVAEVWAKTIILAGEERAAELLKQIPALEAFWITRDGRVVHYGPQAEAGGV